jgi:hypothetical protein
MTAQKIYLAKVEIHFGADKNKKENIIEPGKPIPAALAKKFKNQIENMVLKGDVKIQNQIVIEKIVESKSDIVEPTDEEVTQAISKIPQDEDSWTVSGKPDANKLGDILEKRVSAEQRDRVWEALKKNGAESPEF